MRLSVNLWGSKGLHKVNKIKDFVGIRHFLSTLCNPASICGGLKTRGLAAVGLTKVYLKLTDFAPKSLFLLGGSEMGAPVL